MDDYPIPYVEHNLPLILLSGLGEDEGEKQQNGNPRRAESGARILIESPECRNETSQQLLREFKAWDGSSFAWNSTSLPGPMGSIRYRMKTIGRTYTLPARKAAPVPQSPGEGGSTPRNTELHSPLSPLSPGSPVFPDGLLTPFWFSKHQRQDEQLKTDINAIRNAFARSGFRTRLAVVLISDQSILHAPELEDRMASIRRATALDSKTGLFFKPPMSSQVEVATFVQTTLAALQPYCVEYYRDLAKHSRRKKGKGGPSVQVNSPIGGASQSTSIYGWSVRYEVKQGVFAEFRQEMDVAERHYSSAIEELFSDGGILQTTNSWSPRWNEARLLCDVMALRVFRCLLWTRQTTAAVQLWLDYKLRMKDLVDRRGKGSHTYGWDAWEARWSNVMAHLIKRADLQTLQRPFQDDAGHWSAQQVYAIPEKSSVPADRLPPFNFLHHPGYFLNLVARNIRRRWEKALAIPEYDRVPPDQSPASSVANRSKNYELYMVPDPHEEAIFDHAAAIERTSNLATEEFEARRQPRMSEQVRLELAGDLVAIGRHFEACKVLIHLWEESTWRENDWNEPLLRLLTLLLNCVSQSKTHQNATLLPALIWELLSIAPSSIPGTDLDITRCLDDWDLGQRLELRLHDRHTLSPFFSTFAFKDRQGHVGEPVQCQLTITYDTITSARPIQLSRVELQLGGKKIAIRHDDTTAPVVNTVDLYQAPQASETGDGTFESSANLALHPGHTRVIHVALLLREAQDALEITKLAYSIETSKFSLSHEFNADNIQPGTRWYLQEHEKIETVLLPHLDTKSAAILPKPPKMKIHLQGLRKQYYTDEQVHIPMEVVNDESEPVQATLSSRIVGTAAQTISTRWAKLEADRTEQILGTIETAGSANAELLLQGPPEAESVVLLLDLTYYLLSDPETLLTKTLSVELPFIKPYHARFTFTPRLHPDPWPSYFDPDTCEESNMQNSICHLWDLGAQVTSIVDVPLKIKRLELQVHDVQGNCVCDIDNTAMTSPQELLSRKNISGTFELTTRKSSLDDRRPSFLDLSLLVTWLPPNRDVGSTTESTSEAHTTISVPRLTIPTSEPRVLCTSVPGRSGDFTTLKYHLENSSTHFLTFSLTLEASDDFAFSGAKHRALSLAPLSRHVVEYEILLHKELDDDEDGMWISPNLQVVDSYYQKKLLVHPGGRNIRLDDKSGEIMVWIGRRGDQTR